MSAATRAAAVVLALAAAMAGAVDAAPALPAGAPPASSLPGESVYQVGARLQTADGGWRSMVSLADRPVILAMFYSSCTSVCPILVPQMQRIEAALGAAERSHVRFVLVSLDSVADTPDRLAAFASAHHLDQPGWIVARASATDVRSLAAVLGVRYRQLPDGSFNHSTAVTLLDERGVVRGRSQVPADDDRDFLAKMRALLQ